MSTARLEGFSDGVFAVAITLLSLDLLVPGHATFMLVRRRPLIDPALGSFSARQVLTSTTPSRSPSAT